MEPIKIYMFTLTLTLTLILSHPILIQIILNISMNKKMSIKTLTDPLSILQSLIFINLKLMVLGSGL